jgi:hypothetical protein
MAVWIIAIIAALCAVGMCSKLMADMQMLKERYIKLEEWAEDWLKRLEQKCEANTGQTAKLAAKIVQMEDLLPKDHKGEMLRNHVLLQQLNDEMERNLQMEKDWNDGVAAILNYGKPITEVNRNE